jgi:hypothetical protein
VQRTEAGDAVMRSAGFDPYNPIRTIQLDKGTRANQASGNNELGGYTISSALFGGLEVAQKA